MYVEQLYTGCLSEAAYFIESNGEAAIIDPLRDTEIYLDLAKAKNARIKYIFETHFHADFVSGHLDLHKQTQAPIIYGPNTSTNFPIHLAKDGEIFSLGNITIEAIHTPGHTLESTCYLLRDENKKPYCIFTGDTLFVGDVGRPDLSSGEMSKEDLASIMYDSIKNKILPLANDIIVYPAHGAGSSCGKNLSSRNSSTIGEEKETNYALQPQTREEFIKAVTDGLDAPPEYFSINAEINKNGYDSLEKIKQKGMTPLSVEDFKNKINEEVLVLDTRNALEFTQGFIPGAVFIGLEGRFAEWAGSILPFEQRVMLVTEKGKEEETIVRLARVGFDKVEGYLKDGFEAWKNAGENIDMIVDIDADELALDIKFDANANVIDVRTETEFANSHVKNAMNVPLAEMSDIAQIANFEETQNLYIHCGTGYRSVIACALLKRQGYQNLRNVVGGWDKIKEEKGIEKAKEVSVLN
jgi:hydroxyacylglutathione hydrolase